MNILRPLLGLLVFMAVLYALSENRRRINWRLIAGGMTLQLLLAAAFLKTEIASALLSPVASFFVQITDFSHAGATFLFGGLVDVPAMKLAVGSNQAYIFAFHVLPTIIFFSALTSLLYYLGILQRIVFAFAWLMKRVMRLSGAESLAAAGEVFLGQTESALLVKPYVPTMTRSELITMMIGGMATIAGGVMSAYISMLGGEDRAAQEHFARLLLCASLMSAPAAIVVAKMLVPETHPVDESLQVPQENSGANFFDALAKGTTEGLHLALNVGAMLIAFIAFAAMMNGALTWIGSIIPAGSGTSLNQWITSVSGGVFTSLSLTSIFGTLMAPAAWLIGVDDADLLRAGQLLGTKLALNEFVAYDSLSKMTSLLQERTVFLMSFALCGFANLGSIGIQIGGMGVLAPAQRPALAALGVKALIGGTIATMMTATIAGLLH